MKARCGLEDCDCEYTIEKLAKVLEAVEWLWTPPETPSAWTGKVCPLCAEYEEYGHLDDCQVGVALTAVKR